MQNFLKIQLLKLLSFVFIFASIVACKKKQVSSTNPEKVMQDTILAPAHTEINSDEMMLRDYLTFIQQSRVDYKTLEMDGNADIETSDEEISFSFKIRMIQDSVIWIQFKKLGLEGVRVLANSQGITYIDRLHRSYTHKSWKQLQQELKANIDFSLLQDIISGNPPMHPDLPLVRKETSENTTIISGQENELKILLFGITDQAIFQMENIRSDQQQHMIVKLNDKKLLYDNVKFSYLRDLEILSNNKKQLYVSLQFDEVKRNTTFSVPFEIPANYRESN